MYTVEKLKSKLESINGLLNSERFKELSPFLKLNKNLIEDVISNYEKGEEYITLQINTFKSVAGIIIPLEVAEASIKILEEILNGR